MQYNAHFNNPKVREIIFSTHNKEDWKLYIYYCQLLSHRNSKKESPEYGRCNPSYETLMKECQIKNRNTISKYNNRLKELGLLDWTTYWDSKMHKNKSNYYIFPLEKSTK